MSNRALHRQKRKTKGKKVQHSSLSRTHAHCEGQIRREPPDSMLRFVVRFPEPLEWKAFISGEISLRRYRDNLHRPFSRRIGLSFLNSADFGASTDRRSKVAGCLHVAHPHASHGESVVSEHGRQGSAISKHPTIPKADLSFSTIKKKDITPASETSVGVAWRKDASDKKSRRHTVTYSSQAGIYV